VDSLNRSDYHSGEKPPGARWPTEGVIVTMGVHAGSRLPRAARAALAALAALAAVGGAALVGALGVASPWAGAAWRGKTGTIVAVGAENEYADVISQIGGSYVRVTAIMSNPNTDPHTFESSARVSQLVSAAQLVIQNGVGYDTFMTKIEAASPSASRKVIDVQKLLGLPASTPNPHLWYKPSTMPAVAKAVEKDLTRLQPEHASYFQQNLRVFDASLAPYVQELARIKAAFPAAAVATTEPVADYMLQASSIDNMTPFTLQAAIMNGTDPSPQDISLQDSLLTRKKIRVLVYNQQVTDSVTQSFLKLAHENHVPIVGVYETMPTPGYHYQSWMLAEADALFNALAKGASSPKL
jgi:zinc/manganese transport system substrate-binding protein